MSKHWFMVALVLAASCSSFDAQADTAEDEQALDAGHSALQLFAEGRWQPAYDHFLAAERLSHSPVFALYMARCRANQGRLLDASALYEGILREPLAANAPAPWRDARADAESELVALKVRMPRVELALSPNGGALASLELDGRALDSARAGRELAVDPGDHRLLAGDSRHQVAAASFHIAEGQHLTITLQFPAPPSEPTRHARSAPSSSAPSSPPADGATQHRPDRLSVALWSAGALGIVVGSVSGGVALAEAHAIHQNCAGDHCLTSDRARGDRASALATVSTVSFVLGGLGLAAGSAWFFAAPRVTSERSALSGVTLSAGGRF